MENGEFEHPIAILPKRRTSWALSKTKSSFSYQSFHFLWLFNRFRMPALVALFIWSMLVVDSGWGVCIINRQRMFINSPRIGSNVIRARRQLPDGSVEEGLVPHRFFHELLPSVPINAQFVSLPLFCLSFIQSHTNFVYLLGRPFLASNLHLIDLIFR